MQTDSRDNLSSVAAREDIFLGALEPLLAVRTDIEDALTRQVPETIVESIELVGEPKFLTHGRALDGEFFTSHAGFASLGQVRVNHGPDSDAMVLTVCITVMYGRGSDPAKLNRRNFLDIEDDAASGFEQATFAKRMDAFRDATV